MANKFTKSVLERQAKEMRQHPARAAKPAGEGETPAQEAPAAATAAIPAEQPGGGSGSRAQSGGTARRAARAPRARRQAAQARRAARRPDRIHRAGRGAHGEEQNLLPRRRRHRRAAPRGGRPEGDRQQAGQRHPAEDSGALICKAERLYSIFGAPHGPCSPKLGTVASFIPRLFTFFFLLLVISPVFHAVRFSRRTGACP